MTTYKSRYFLVLIIIFVFCMSIAYAGNVNLTYKNLVGSTRYDTAIKVSKEAYPNGAKNIILVAGTSNVDGIIVAPLAKSLNAPILLVEKNKISNNVKAEIKRLKPTKAYLIGGTGVLSNTVINELKTLNIASERVYGDTRYTTAIAIAKKVGTFNQLIICNSKDGGKNAAAIIGLAAQKNIPVLYNDSNSSINAKTYTYIKDNTTKVKTIYLIGNGLSTAQQKELRNKGVAVVKIAGKTPYDINVEMLNKLNTKTNSIALVNNAVDAISISYLAAKTNSILLYTNTRLTTEQKNIINDNSIKTIYYAGGGKIKGAVKDAIYTVENKKVNTDTTLEFNKSKVVFYIPHQDDESSYFSQTILKAIREKGAENVYIVMITDGAGSSLLKEGRIINSKNKTMREILYEHRFISSENASIDEVKAAFSKARDNEYKAACKVLGFLDKNVFFNEDLGFKRLEDGKTKAADVKATMQYFENKFKGDVTHVSYSFAFETHNDHQQIGQALNELYYDLSLKEDSFRSVYFLVRQKYEFKDGETDGFEMFELKELKDSYKILDALNVYVTPNCSNHKEDYKNLKNKEDHRLGIGNMSAPKAVEDVVNKVNNKTLVTNMHLPN